MSKRTIIAIMPADGWHVRTWDPNSTTIETVVPLIGWALVEARDSGTPRERAVIGMVADFDTYLADEFVHLEYVAPAYVAETIARVEERVARAEIEATAA